LPEPREKFLELCSWLPAEWDLGFEFSKKEFFNSIFQQLQPFSPRVQRQSYNAKQIERLYADPATSDSPFADLSMRYGAAGARKYATALS
jgi:hypothetical protein